jgi:hypothetical protein
MSLSSEQTKGVNGLYHMQLNPNPKGGEDKRMKQEDWVKAAEIAETHLGLTNQKRVIVLHEKSGRVHAHIVWERYDHDKGRLISDSKNYKAQDKAREELERVFNHERTPQKRDKTHEPAHKERLTELWQSAKNGRDFIEKAQAAGYEIAKGLDRRPFKVISPEGVSLDLVRQLQGVNTKSVAEWLNSENLPLEAQALKKQKPQLQTKALAPANDNEPFQKIEDLQATKKIERSEPARKETLFAAFKENIQEETKSSKEQKFEQFKEAASENTKTEQSKKMEDYLKEAERILEENRQRKRDRGLDR